MEKINKKAQIEALRKLKNNTEYVLISNELKKIKEGLNKYILDENFDHSKKSELIIKYNLINNFLELPADLLRQFEI